MGANPLVLIVEDELVIRNFITTVLSSEDYDTLQAHSAKEAFELVVSHQPDLVLLDLGLPDMDGVTVIKKFRQWSTVPIIVVSARQLEKEKVEALDAGADDYLTKPFGNQELLARIRSTLRRVEFVGNEMEHYRHQGLSIEFQRRLITQQKRNIHLTPIEYKIIELLAKNSGKVLTHDAIIKHVWGPYASDPQVLRVNMANIRRKIEENPADPKYILTEVGVGYRMPEGES